MEDRKTSGCESRHSGVGKAELKGCLGLGY